MKTLLLLLFLTPAAFATNKDNIPFATRIITQNGEKIRVIQPMLPLYFEVDGNDAGLAEKEVMMCRIMSFKQKDVSGGEEKAIVQEADIECKNGQYRFQVKRILFESNDVTLGR
jgi:hypothetical protein